METLTIKVTDEKALKALREMEEKHLIEIIEHFVPDSLALPGSEINEEDIRKWADRAELAPSISLNEARLRWEIRKKKIQQTGK
ncbi:MAG: hypothetical protein K0B09_11595 [Bacteroidales bacterium]|nr:hypothetical protein [Bacteroidales bacterium]